MIYDAIYYLLSSVKQAFVIWLLIEGIISIYHKKFVLKRGVIDFVFLLWLITMMHIVGMYDLHLTFGENATRMEPKILPIIGTAGGLDVLNILLFLPFGFLIPLGLNRITWTYKKIVIITIPIVFTIEILQYFGGRLFDIDDVIANVLGALLGYFLHLKYVEK